MNSSLKCLSVPNIGWVDKNITNSVLDIKKHLVGGAFNIQMFLFEWCQDPDLNWGHGDFQSPALPTELSRL